MRRPSSSVLNVPSILSATERAALFDPPTDHDEAARRYSLAPDELALANGKRRDRNRLGFAVQFMLVRDLGRTLRVGEMMSGAVIDVVADQLGVDPDAFDLYGARDETRREHALEIADLIGLRTIAQRDYRAAIAAAVLTAAATERGAPIVTAVLIDLKERGILVPASALVERFALAGRAQARRHAYRELGRELDDATRESLKGLLVDRSDWDGPSLFGWIGEVPEGPSQKNLTGVALRLRHVRAIGLTDDRRKRIHANRYAMIAREAKVTQARELMRVGEARRTAVLVAPRHCARTNGAQWLDHRTAGRSHRSRHRDVRSPDRSRTPTGKDPAQGTATRTCRRDGSLRTQPPRSVPCAGERPGTGTSARPCCRTVPGMAPYRRRCGYPWTHVREGWRRRFGRADRPPPFSSQGGPDHVRRLRPALVQVERSDPERRRTAALALRRRTNQAACQGADRLPQEPLASPGPRRDARLRSPRLGGRGPGSPARPPALGRHLGRGKPGLPHLRGLPAAEADLRDHAVRRATWPRHPRQLRDLARGAHGHVECEARGTWPAAAEANRLPDATIDAGGLTLSPIRRDRVLEHRRLSSRLYSLVPRIRITDLLSEVDGWTGFANAFTHYRTGEAVREGEPALMGAILADATNMGFERMAESSRGLSLHDLNLVIDRHVRPETYATAIATLVDAQHAEPLSAVWGPGDTSSSDGQFFPAGGWGEGRAEYNARHGKEPGSVFYGFISDRFASFFSKVIPAAASEAPYVLDGLMHNEAVLQIREHSTDTAGAVESIFALFHLFGYRFAPRIRDLGERRLFTMERGRSYGVLDPMIAGPVNMAVIEDNWEEVLRPAASIHAGTVLPSHVLRKIAAFPRQNALNKALREIGRIERSIFMADWLSEPTMRRRSNANLNKGESRHFLARAVFFN